MNEPETPETEPERKETRWYLPSLREEVRGWPKDVREEVGRQLNRVEYGGDPFDFKPMKTIGAGVNEIRHSDDGDQYRLIYVAKFREAIYVLHVITKKKTQQTSQHDIDLAKKRYKMLIAERKRLGL
jgi:phage-related protein